MMNARMKLEGSDIISMMPQTTEQQRAAAQAAYDKALAAAQEYIITHINAVKLSIEGEEGAEDATFPMLQDAVLTARTEELVSFVRTGRIPFEDGYIRFKITK